MVLLTWKGKMGDGVSFSVMIRAVPYAQGLGEGRSCLLDAFHAELLVCLAGLQEVAKLGITRIILEVDATMLKDAILTDDYRLTPTGGVITEIKQLIGAEFMSFTVSVCKRVCNSVAHALAVSGCNLPSGCYKTWEGYLRMLRLW
jgi:hypothetical protein